MRILPRHANPTSANHRPLHAVPVLLGIVVVICIGCTRTDYRLRADKQSYEIVSQKADDPRWSLPDFDLTPDPRSRFYDPYCIDRPPLPPDDPTAHRYMECVDGMHGWRHWDQFGQISHVENPEWPVFLGGEPLECDDSPLPSIDRLSLADALELGLVNSRDYQEQLEDVYLSALSLTYQRYRFDIRPRGFLGEPGSEMFVEYDGENNGTLGLGPSNLGFSKLMPSGAQLVAELSNNTLWLFSGSGGPRTASTLAFSVVQPLMAGAGRDIVLENLTQSERNTLYAVRRFARFRKDFYVTIVTGSRAIPLPGSSGQGELAFLIRGERSPTVGYYHLLYLLQRLRNEQSNVRELETRFREMKAQHALGRASELDVTQLQSSLEGSRGNMLLRKRGYENELDRFKVQLGLPPDMEIKMDDTLLEPFQFREPRLTKLEKIAGEFRDEVEMLPADASDLQLQAAIEELGVLCGEISQAFKYISDRLGHVEEVMPQRLGMLDESESAEWIGALAGDLMMFRENSQRFDSVKKTSEELTRCFQGSAPTPADRAELASQLGALGTDCARISRKLSGLGSTLKVELINLPPVVMDQSEAISRALSNRLDLMNRRAFVMDARRRVEVAADRLKATLDVVVEGELNTPDAFDNSNPLGFQADQSDFRAGLKFVTPLDRRRQRNDYRAALVSYQRARRNYMTAKDQVKLDVRREMRRVRMESEFFEISRRALRVAVKELEQAIESGEKNGEEANKGAQQGISIPRALGNIIEAQDALIETWVDYETARLKLARDTGLLQIDEHGCWPEADQAKMSEEGLGAGD